MKVLSPSHSLTGEWTNTVPKYGWYCGVLWFTKQSLGSISVHKNTVGQLTQKKTTHFRPHMQDKIQDNTRVPNIINTITNEKKQE